jgi:hypothetical protein
VITFLTVCYVACFQACAIPAAVRIVRRGSSRDLSMWREVLILSGASLQLTVMLLTGARWQVWISPVASLVNVAVLLAVIWKFRR